MTETKVAEKKSLKRDLGLSTAILLVIANTFSGNIFVLLSEGAEAAGSLLPLSYLLGSFLAFLIGVVYAEVASSMPKAGANLAYSFSAYGRGAVSFILSWLTIMGHIAYGAINALGFGLYLAVFLHMPAVGIAVALVIIFGLINLKGVKEVGGVGKWSAIISLTLVGIFIILVCLHLDSTPDSLLAPLQVPISNYFSIFAGTSLIFSAFIGFEAVASLAEEIKEPHKNIPRSIFAVIGITSVLYVGIAYLTVYALPIRELAASSAPLSLLARETAGGVALVIISIAALVATATALLIDILITSRKVYEVALEGYLPRSFRRISKSGVPHLSVIAITIAMILLILTDSIALIAHLGNTTFLLFAAMLALGTIIMRKKRPYLHRPFRTFLFPFIPIVVIVLSVLVIIAAGSEAIFWLFTWIVLGFTVYLFSFMRRNRLVPLLVGAFLAGGVALFLFLPVIV